MKQIIYILLAALLLCSIATASMRELNPYTIRVIVWDTDGNRESDVAVTFTHDGQEDTLYTASDGTVAFSTLNFGDVPDGAYINVSCKYGTKLTPIDYSIGATGVTFNEPSKDTAIAAFAALGFLATVIGGGLYWLRRKKE